METPILLPLTPEEAKTIKHLIDTQLSILAGLSNSDSKVKEFRNLLHSINLKLIIAESESIEKDRAERFRKGV